MSKLARRDLVNKPNAFTEGADPIRSLMTNLTYEHFALLSGLTAAPMLGVNRQTGRGLRQPGTEWRAAVDACWLCLLATASHLRRGVVTATRIPLEVKRCQKTVSLTDLWSLKERRYRTHRLVETTSTCC